MASSGNKPSSGSGTRSTTGKGTTGKSGSTRPQSSTITKPNTLTPNKTTATAANRTATSKVPTASGAKSTLKSATPSRPLTTTGTQRAATVSKPLATKTSPVGATVTKRAPVTTGLSSTRQARLALQAQRRRNQQTITGVFIGLGALILIVVGVLVYQAIPKPTPKAPVYGILADITHGKSSNISGVAGKIVTLSDGVQYVDVKNGTGATLKASDSLHADYTGWLSDGTIFDASANHGGPASFSLSGVIKGWTEGLPGMKVGGERRLMIPGAEAYGANPPSGSNIPANATLYFDVTLVSIP